MKKKPAEYNLIAEPITKRAEESKLLSKNDEQVKNYSEHEPMLLGQLLMRHIGNAFGFNEKIGMEDYLAHLQSVAAKEDVEKVTSEYATSLSQELTSGMANLGYENQAWFGEVPFLPSKNQVDRVKSLWKKQENYSELLQKMGYKSGLKPLIIEIVTNKNFRFLPLAINDEGGVLPGLSLEEMAQVKMKSDGELLGEQQVELIQGLVAVASYVHFDYSNIDWEKDDILAEIASLAQKKKNIIASGTARLDLLGFGARDDDPEAGRVLDGIKTLLASRVEEETTLDDIRHMHHFSKLPLHSIDQYTEEERKLAREALKMIVDGRLCYQMVEVKGNFTKYAKDETGKDAKIIFNTDEIPQKYYEDVSHSMFAMWQWLRVAGEADELAEMLTTRTSEAQSLRSVMNGDAKDGSGYSGLIALMKGFLSGPNRVYLARFSYPVIDHAEKGDWNYGEEYSQATHMLSPRKMVLEMGRVGKRMLKQVHGY